VPRDVLARVAAALERYESMGGHDITASDGLLGAVRGLLAN
jgi:hypothetical protein